jgi:hypothetical protein
VCRSCCAARPGRPLDESGGLLAGLQLRCGRPRSERAARCDTQRVGAPDGRRGVGARDRHRARGVARRRRAGRHRAGPDRRCRPGRRRLRGRRRSCGAGPDVAGAHKAVTARPCWCCAGFSMPPGLPNSRATTSSAPSTAYRYLYEAIAVLAGAPSVHGGLLAARTAGHTHVHPDGTLIRTDRCRAIGPTAGVDLWWSGKHQHHGERPGHHRAGRRAVVDLRRAPRPRARHHLRPRP